MNPRVKNAVPLENFKLFIEFDNGETGEYDCSHLLDFGVFKELQNINYFRQVRVQYGTVTWPNDQDICPDTVYLDSLKLQSDLMQASESSSRYMS